MAFKVGVDIGGTFTDCVVAGSNGERRISKSLTTHESLADGVLSAVSLAAEQWGLSSEELLAQTSLFVHGTTVATNAVLTRTGARTGLLTTKGHEDSLIVGKVYAKRAGLAERDVVHASRLDKPVPLVPPERIRAIPERIDVEGDVLVALDEQRLIEAIDSLVDDGVEAIAVSFLWSFVNAQHELRVKELLGERAPGVFASFSCELAPVLGEYERTATTVLNAYVGPKVAGYLSDLGTRLRAGGLGPPLLVMQASGGLTSVEDASVSPISTLDSGPTGGILGCRFISGLYGEPNVICTDVGGTSFDVGVVLDGELPLEPDPVVSQYTFRMPKVAVHSIGAGGGSIAWLDEGGLLRVGPQSAGSRPGPACYGLGGTEPTVTDADVALGYLDPDFFLGGRMRLDRDLALRALAGLGAQLGMEPEEVAIGVFRIINSHMADLIRRMTIEQGNDPRNCVLVAYGGAGPTHAVFYGGDIDAKAILVLAESTVFSAEGMLTCDLTHTAQASYPRFAPFTAEDVDGLTGLFDSLEEKVRGEFTLDGVSGDVGVRRTLGVRYQGQVHSLEVDVPGRALSLDDVETFQAAFEHRYASLYGKGSLFSGVGLEYDICRVTGTHAVEPVGLPEHELGSSDASAARKGEREAWFEQTGFAPAAIYDGAALQAGSSIEGPAVVERMGDSVVIPPGYSGEVDRFLTLRMEKVASAVAPEPAAAEARR